MADIEKVVRLQLEQSRQGPDIFKNAEKSLKKLNSTTVKTGEKVKAATKNLGKLTSESQTLINKDIMSTKRMFENNKQRTTVIDSIKKNGDMQRKMTTTIKGSQKEINKYNKDWNKALNLNKKFDLKKTNKMWKDATQINDKFNNTVVRTNKNMTNLGDRQVASTIGFNKYNKEVKRTSSTITQSNMPMKNMLKSTKNLKNGLFAQSQKFNMAALSAMFFGMAIKNVAEQLTRMTVGVFMKLTEGSTEAGKGLNRLGAHWEFLKFTVGSVIAEALLPVIPAIIDVVETIRNWIEENPKLTASLIKWTAIIGTVLFLVGTLALGITGLMWVGSLISGVFSGVAAAVAYLGTYGIVGLLPVLGTLFLALVLLMGGVILFKKSWESNFGDIKGFTKDTIDNIKLVLEGLGTMLLGVVKGDVTTFAEGFAAIMASLINVVDDVMTSIVNIIGNLMAGELNKVLQNWIDDINWFRNLIGKEPIELKAPVFKGHVFDSLLESVGGTRWQGMKAYKEELAKITAEKEKIAGFAGPFASKDMDLTGANIFGTKVPDLYTETTSPGTIPSVTQNGLNGDIKSMMDLFGNIGTGTTNNNQVINIDGSNFSITELQDMLKNEFGLDRDTISSNTNLSNLGS